ncbi:MAG: aminopeptidase [Eubacteriales bacterium]|nr:aminopeptidase [Eubacteriales bacterium]
METDQQFRDLMSGDDSSELEMVPGDFSYQGESVWDTQSPEWIEAAYDFSDGYRDFLDRAKTEREFVREAIKILEAAGFQELEDRSVLKPGDRVYESIHGKGLMAAIIGEDSAYEGFNLLGAHVDSPRIDLKPNPLYEQNGLGYFSTHYYGGIKKYQWSTIPLALHGVIHTQDGQRVEVCIGEDESDPIFTITDLLPHLAAKQMQKSAATVIEGEELRLLISSTPDASAKGKQAIKTYLLKLLNAKYGIVEEDFFAAELEIVPAFKARDLGFDRSMIAAYGHDDRVCAYCSLMALVGIEGCPERTAVCMLSDKEEVGSAGNTGAQSRLYENFLLALIDLSTQEEFSELRYRRALAKSMMLSTDVSNAYDPVFASVSDLRNNSQFAHGSAFLKYTGVRGKSGASEANAEFVARVFQLMREAKLPYQIAELGRVDVGGGGTICQLLANWGMEVLDAGVPVLSMHSPLEICHKLDVYAAYLSYQTFLTRMRLA